VASSRGSARSCSAATARSGCARSAPSLKHLQMARDRGQTHGERLCQLGHGRVPLGESHQDGPAGRVR
jgi:hypothetical protein